MDETNVTILYYLSFQKVNGIKIISQQLGDVIQLVFHVSMNLREMRYMSRYILMYNFS
jgi:hypothetical protein